MTDVRLDDTSTPLALLRPHWRLVLAAFLGWFLDAFDQVALLLVLPEVGNEFGVSLTLMGLVITAQSLGRIAGNVGWGWLADRYGRKLAFMIGVIWFAACSGLTGLAWSYAALAYAVSAASQAVATYALPRSAQGLGLGTVIAGFVIASSLAVAAVVIRDPRRLPGTQMDGEAA